MSTEAFIFWYVVLAVTVIVVAATHAGGNEP